MKEGWVVDKDEFLRKIRRSVSIWMQKAPCCAESLERSDRDIILLDADAFVWNPLDSVFLKDFDVGLTMRRLDDIRIGIDGGVRCAKPVPYHAINAGAMFFRNNDRSLDFVRLWIEKMSVTRYFLVEQTALALLVLEADESAFTAYERGIRIETDRAPIAVRLLPCEKYNNFYIGDDLSFTPDSVYVAHFKGYLHRQAYFSSLSNLVEQRLVQHDVERGRLVADQPAITRRIENQRHKLASGQERTLQVQMGGPAARMVCGMEGSHGSQ